MTWVDVPAISAQLGSLVNEAYDTVETTYIGGNITTLTFQKDGEIVVVLRIEYAGDNIVTVTRVPIEDVVTYYHQGRNPIFHYRMAQESGPLNDDGSAGDDLVKIGTVQFGEGSFSPGLMSVFTGDGHFEKTASVTGASIGTHNFASVLWLTKYSWPDDTTRGPFILSGSTSVFKVEFSNVDESMTVTLTDDAGVSRTQTYGAAKVFDKMSRFDMTCLTLTFDREITEFNLYVDGEYATADSSTGSALSALGAITLDSSIKLGTSGTSSNRWYGNIGELWINLGTGWWDNHNDRNVFCHQKGGLVHYKFDSALPIKDYGSAADDLNETTGDMLYNQPGPYGMSGSCCNDLELCVNNRPGEVGHSAPTTVVEIDKNDFIILHTVRIPTNHDRDWLGHFGCTQFFPTTGHTYKSGWHCYWMYNYALYEVLIQDESMNQNNINVSEEEIYNLMKADGEWHEIVHIYDRSEQLPRITFDGRDCIIVQGEYGWLDGLTDDIKFDCMRSMCGVDMSNIYGTMRGGVANFFVNTGLVYYHNFPAHYEEPVATKERQGGTPLCHYKFIEFAANGLLHDFGSAKRILRIGSNNCLPRVPLEDNLKRGMNDNNALAPTETACFYGEPSQYPAVDLGIGTDDFTTVMWFQIDPNPTGGTRGHFYFDGNGSSTFYSYYECTGGIFHFDMADDSANAYQFTIAKTDLFDVASSRLTELVLQFDRSEAAVVARVNGRIVPTQTVTGSLSGMTDDITLDKGRVMMAYIVIAGSTCWGTMAEFYLTKGLSYRNNW